MAQDIVKRAFFPMFYHKREGDEEKRHSHWTKGEHIIGTLAAILADIVILFLIGTITFFTNIVLGILALVCYQIGIEVLAIPISRIYRKIMPAKIKKNVD